MGSEIIYLVRHGQTEWNRDGILQGQLDSPLTDKGRKQSQAIGQYLAHILPDGLAGVHMECSHLGRARATADIISDIIGLDRRRLSVSELLAEFHLGEWQGFDKGQIETRWPGLLAERERDKWHFQIPGGENYSLLIQRARAWLDQKPKAPVTIVVTHQQFSNALRGLYGKLTPAETLQLVHKQHCFFRLHNGKIECFYTETEASHCD
jgi:probable phosphoglycerate mutase